MLLETWRELVRLVDTMRPRCWRCIHCTPAVTRIDGRPLCSEHAKAASEEPKDIVIAPVKGGIALLCEP
jgi:hypothetical protein